MPIEVEQKFHVADPSSLERQLTALGGEEQETMIQVDCYFAHPNRDFARTDEALRLRQVGKLNYITYKGPKLDPTTKTRREVEIRLASGQQTADAAASLLEALGFTRVAEVRKRRTPFRLRWQDREIGVSLDNIVELGNFVELEIVTNRDEVAAAQACLASLAGRL
ncbi:MAG TPA: class IV adenylate cyclase, partial [Pirellulales bacterium]|nr:class IV adenylate cyclase [Pirellulales bacterium]